MDVKIKPLSGCLRVFLGVMTLGVAPLLAWLNERNWPGRLMSGDAVLDYIWQRLPEQAKHPQA